MATIIKRLILILLGLLLLPANASAKTAFPEIDRDKLVISLFRSGCFGSCPDYMVSITGNGEVTFSTRPPPPWLSPDGSGTRHRFYRFSWVRVEGVHHARIDMVKVDALIAKFQAAKFFDLKDSYRANVTDSSSYVVSIDTGHGKKTVFDYVGRQAGMPPVVTALQDAIDQAAGSDRWIKGTPDVIELLRAEGSTFDGIVGAELLDAAVARGDLVTMDRLLSFGAPLKLGGGPDLVETAIQNERDNTLDWLASKGLLMDRTAYVSTITIAVKNDNHSAINLLMVPEKVSQIDKPLATILLTDAADHADLNLVTQLLELGADPNGPEPTYGSREPPLFRAANGMWRQAKRHSVDERRAVLRKLLDSGARVTYCRTENFCRSPLWHVSDPEIAELLIVAGADPNFIDFDGHVLFSINSEDVALVLLAHGASRDIKRPGDKWTLRKWAEYNRWSCVLVMLDGDGNDAICQRSLTPEDDGSLTPHPDGKNHKPPAPPPH